MVTLRWKVVASITDRKLEGAYSRAPGALCKVPASLADTQSLIFNVALAYPSSLGREESTNLAN